ncbi:MAG TPA: hypothetical protein PLN31_14600 [Azoarcus taiwanensis]|nr:hypothetical protein [Azoarcus taiwanensis]
MSDRTRLDCLAQTHLVSQDVAPEGIVDDGTDDEALVRQQRDATCGQCADAGRLAVNLLQRGQQALAGAEVD